MTREQSLSVISKILAKIAFQNYFFPGLPFDESLVKSDKKLEDPEILKLLKTSNSTKATKKKKKAAEKAAAEGEAAPKLVEQ